MNLTISKRITLLAGSLALGLTLSGPILTASAATLPSGMVQAEINGKAFPAIAVGSTTYLKWQALDVFKTPYQYLGDGKFALTGGTVQGVVFEGDTYLPWDSVAPRVKASRIKGGGFNFTAVAVPHHYQMAIDIQNGAVGTPDVFRIFTQDGNETVPNQAVKISLQGNTYLSDYTHQSSTPVTTGADGNWIGALNDPISESTTLTVTWTDPIGKLHTGTVPVKFSSNVPQGTYIPADSSIVATVPMETFQDALFFNAQEAGQTVLFQLDTGAFEPLITKQVAHLLNLPKLGNTKIRGIGGQDTAYASRISLIIGGQQFSNIPCVVDDSYPGPSLFGYGFFVSSGYDVLVSQKHQTITILK